VESALIFETKHAATQDYPAPWRTRFDRIVVITAPLELRRQRYIARCSGLTPEEASKDFDRRCAAQWSEERKAALADYVIANDDTLDDLRDEVQTLWEALRAESADRAAEAM
jgi:dephospho-CoA kinase